MENSSQPVRSAQMISQRPPSTNRRACHVTILAQIIQRLRTIFRIAYALRTFTWLRTKPPPSSLAPPNAGWTLGLVPSTQRYLHATSAHLKVKSTSLISTRLNPSAHAKFQNGKLPAKNAFPKISLKLLRKEPVNIVSQLLHKSPITQSRQKARLVSGQFPLSSTVVAPFSSITSTLPLDAPNLETFKSASCWPTCASCRCIPKVWSATCLGIKWQKTRPSKPTLTIMQIRDSKKVSCHGSFTKKMPSKWFKSQTECNSVLVSATKTLILVSSTDWGSSWRSMTLKATFSALRTSTTNFPSVSSQAKTRLTCLGLAWRWGICASLTCQSWLLRMSLSAPRRQTISMSYTWLTGMILSSMCLSWLKTRAVMRVASRIVSQTCLGGSWHDAFLCLILSVEFPRTNTLEAFLILWHTHQKWRLRSLWTWTATRWFMFRTWE